MAKQITFSYKDKDYILEFNRDTVKKSQDMGLSIEKLEECDKNPFLALEVVPLLWRCAFLMHHPSVDKNLVEEMYKELANKEGDKDEDGLIFSLMELYSEPLNTLLEQGNVKWSKSW